MKYLIISFLALLLMPSMAMAEPLKIYGLFEEMVLPQIREKPIKAKLDTGAQTTSLGAKDISVFEKHDRKWVRFTPQIKGVGPVELPLARYMRVKLRPVKGLKKKNIRRPVVVMQICFDGELRSTEVNLVDRSRFRYPLLIGSSTLIEFSAAVDPGAQYTSTPDCE